MKNMYFLTDLTLIILQCPVVGVVGTPTYHDFKIYQSTLAFLVVVKICGFCIADMKR